MRPVSLALVSGDTDSDCTYYSEYDPFDYLYSGGGGTQYSDPVYEAVIKEDISPMSPGAGKYSKEQFL